MALSVGAEPLSSQAAAAAAVAGRRCTLLAAATTGFGARSLNSLVKSGCRFKTVAAAAAGFGRRSMNWLVAAAADTGLSKLAITLNGAGFGMARSKLTSGGAAGVAPEGVAPGSECTVVVAAGAAPAAPTGAELVIAFRG